MASSTVLHNNRVSSLTKWKGFTHFQLAPFLHKNQYTGGLLDSVKQIPLRNAPPVQHYRREIVAVLNALAESPETCSYNGSFSQTLDHGNQPGGTFGYTHDKDIYTSPQNQTGCICAAVHNDSTANALRRVRSKGAIQPSSSYSSDNRQYLQRRQKTFAQNTFHFVRPGATDGLGDGMSGTHVFAAQGGATTGTAMSSAWNQCRKFLLDTSVTLEYKWLFDSATTTYQVVIPPGEYNTAELNRVFQQGMVDNGTYLLHTGTAIPTKIFLLDIVYNLDTLKIDLICRFYNWILFDYPLYQVAGGGIPAADLILLQTTPTTTYSPYFVLSDATLCITMLGFQGGVGNYPQNFDPNVLYSTTGASRITASSTTAGQAGLVPPPPITPVYWKPSNTNFAQDGAVDSSTLILRKTRRVLDARPPNSIFTDDKKKEYPIRKTPHFPKYLQYDHLNWDTASVESASDVDENEAAQMAAANGMCCKRGNTRF